MDLLQRNKSALRSSIAALFARLGHRRLLTNQRALVQSRISTTAMCCTLAMALLTLSPRDQGVRRRQAELRVAWSGGIAATTHRTVNCLRLGYERLRAPQTLKTGPRRRVHQPCFNLRAGSSSRSGVQLANRIAYRSSTPLDYRPTTVTAAV